MKELYISHLQDTIYESKSNKYHITLLNVKYWICGGEKTPIHSSNGDPITLDWYKANIATDIDGHVCKKCAKKALFILESRAGIIQYNAHEAKREITRRLIAIEKIEDNLFDTTGYGFSISDEAYNMQQRLLNLQRNIQLGMTKSSHGSNLRLRKDATLSSSLNSDEYGVTL